MQEIDRSNIMETIQVLRRAGKLLPQFNRINSAADKQREERNLLGQIVEDWWNIFLPRHISVDLWKEATTRASFISVPGIECKVINPALMMEAIKQINQEWQAAQEKKAAEQKAKENEMYKSENLFREIPEFFELLRLHWKLHRGRKRHIPLPPRDGRVNIGKRFGLTEVESLEQRNFVLLGVFGVFNAYANECKEPNPLRLSVDDRRSVQIVVCR